MNLFSGKGAGLQTSRGTYAGDDAQNRAIPHGLSSAPKLVMIGVATTGVFILNGTSITSAAGNEVKVTAPDATNFYVGDAGGSVNGANDVGKNYTWVALG